MRIECEQCGEIAPAADVWTKGEKVRLECGSCGHLNDPDSGPTSASGDRSDASVSALASEAENGAEGEGESGVDVGASGAATARVDVAEKPWLGEAPHAEGVAAVQCQKCGFRQDGEGSCARCGFVFANYERGEMPWERAIAVTDEDVMARVDELWARALEASTDEAHAAFVEYCRDQEVEDIAGRRYRFHLADWPNDEVARTQLEHMVEHERTRLAAQMDTQRDELHQSVSKFKRRVLIGLFILGLVLAFIFLSSYPNLF